MTALLMRVPDTILQFKVLVKDKKSIGSYTYGIIQLIYVYISNISYTHRYVTRVDLRSSRSCALVGNLIPMLSSILVINHEVI